MAIAREERLIYRFQSFTLLYHDKKQILGLVIYLLLIVYLLFFFFLSLLHLVIITISLLIKQVVINAIKELIEIQYS